MQPDVNEVFQPPVTKELPDRTHMLRKPKKQTTPRTPKAALPHLSQDPESPREAALTIQALPARSSRQTPRQNSLDDTPARLVKALSVQPLNEPFNSGALQPTMAASMMNLQRQLSVPDSHMEPERDMSHVTTTTIDTPMRNADVDTPMRGAQSRHGTIPLTPQVTSRYGSVDLTPDKPLDLSAGSPYAGSQYRLSTPYGTADNELTPAEPVSLHSVMDVLQMDQSAVTAPKPVPVTTPPLASPPTAHIYPPQTQPPFIQSSPSPYMSPSASLHSQMMAQSMANISHNSQPGYAPFSPDTPLRAAASLPASEFTTIAGVPTQSTNVASKF